MCTTTRSHRGQHAATDAGRTPVPVAAPVDRSHPPDEAVRASDAEREAAADELRVHAAAGRLDVDELESRLAEVFAARTRMEVGAVLADLPAAPAPAPPPASTARRAGSELHAYAMVMLLLVAIWLLTGAGHFWPLYPALGWGLPLMLGRSQSGRGRVTTGA